MYSKDSLKLQFGCFWDAYRHLKAQFTGWKLSHPSWAGVVDAFNNPPPAPLPDLSWLLNAEFTPELLCDLAEGKHGPIAALLVDAGFRLAKVGIAMAMNEPVQPPTRARKLAAVA